MSRNNVFIVHDSWNIKRKNYNIRKYFFEYSNVEIMLIVISVDCTQEIKNLYIIKM